MEAANPPAGWYPDPHDERTQRYWDGSTWTESRSPLERKGESAGPGSYVAAVLIPIVGVVLAIIQFARGNVGHGIAVLLTSVVAFFIYLMILGAIAAGDYASCVNDARTLAQQAAC